MIVPITGKVTYAITLDPTVWIFDDRKILLEEAFNSNVNTLDSENEDNELENASKRWDREVYQQKINPPVNKSIKRFEREKILKSSYVMPLDDFLANAEIDSIASAAILVTASGEVTISLDELINSYFLFARDGKPLKEDGPVHLYYKDGSNRENPIKNITKVIIK
ncbi:hypothetical protein QGM71_04835 [Virgibacillus sp. C22-A2]|uniref:Peptidyl-prolyl cis-trans isomerase n=1 Tax=Virgibacillus tibetensis TaxID=3042313 RepID=A0ABU6KCJ8_9BACI|nr:hypothetical protein [Virgibacillus sp. C22-A2]